MHLVVVCSKLLCCVLRGDVCCIAHEHEWDCVPHYVIIQLKPFIMMSLDVLEWRPLEKYVKPIVSPWLFRQMISFVWKAILKKVHPNPWSYLIVIKICLRFMFHNLVYHDTPRIWWTHIWLWPCLTVKGPFYGIHLYSPTLQTQRCSPSWSENVCVQVPIAYMHPLRA